MGAWLARYALKAMPPAMATRTRDVERARSIVDVGHQVRQRRVLRVVFSQVVSFITPTSTFPRKAVFEDWPPTAAATTG